MLTFREKYSNGEKTSVLVHGDLWAGQIFFRNEVDIAGIVDWQAAHLGSPVEDLFRVLGAGTTSAIRRKLFYPLLDYYYDAMLRLLGANMPFSRDYLNEEIVHTAPFSCLTVIVSTGVQLNSDDVKKDKRAAEEYIDRCKCFVEDVIKLCGWQ
ncbi:hypothetical protein OESDEN_05650 [Oesophagostomum dentatum]|uniref:CHK kinase-like domain-containing protein n=1 Tax=Oesophagostomum dentatum TaxID=61180 RepID=A0A0B1TAY3_OESDE|nr:hypothetical protein OESDEN_05650 [Oesophagostomum dentatum]